MATTDKRRVFEAHGVIFTGESGNQLIGRCPFTGKDDKFYVNSETWAWDSKTANISGNISRFLEHTQRRYRTQINGDLLAKLALDRKLPPDAFASFGIGWTGRAYAIGIRDIKGAMVDIRTFKIGGRLMSTPGCHVGLLGAHLIPADPAAPIYICEGEWDCIAWSWVRDRMNAPGIVVGIPGAGTFKPEWVAWFSGRTTHALMDNDGAGINGNEMLAKRLKTVVQRLTIMDWPSGLPEGYDIRDWVALTAVEERNVRKAWTFIHSRFVRHSEVVEAKKSGVNKTGTDDPTPLEQEREQAARRPSAWTDRVPTLADVERVFKKWLFIENMDAVHVMMAAVISQKIEGPPVWLFLVSPPGGAKTETLTTLSAWQDIYTTSGLTTHSLISGAAAKEGHDPSLIPRLNGKVMVIKDFTAILAMRDADKEEIFGILRDAYDGSCGKVFGNGVERNYTSRFGVIAAVTPRIYDMASQHTSLGERFLKFGMGDNLHHKFERDIVHSAIANIDKETDMRFELADVVNAYLSRLQVHPLPPIPDALEQQIISLAMFGARLRGTVSRDVYKNDIIISRPSSEVPSRLGIQLAKLGKSLAIVLGNKEVGSAEYRLLKKVMLDTIPQRNEDLIRHLMLTCPRKDDYVTSQQLAVETRYPIATIARLLQDFNVLDITRRMGNVTRFLWGVTDYIRDVIRGAGLYTTPEEVSRTVRLVFKKVKKAASAPAHPFPPVVGHVNGSRVRVKKRSKLTVQKQTDGGSVPRYPPAMVRRSKGRTIGREDGP